MTRNLFRGLVPAVAAVLVSVPSCASSNVPATPASGNVIPGVEVLFRDSLHLHFRKARRADHQPFGEGP